MKHLFWIIPVMIIIALSIYYFIVTENTAKSIPGNIGGFFSFIKGGLPFFSLDETEMKNYYVGKTGQFKLNEGFDLIFYNDVDPFVKGYALSEESDAPRSGEFPITALKRGSDGRFYAYNGKFYLLLNNVNLS
jgi:hypothetical protein